MRNLTSVNTKPKYSIKDVEKFEDSSVWVMNNTGLNGKRANGSLLLSVLTNAGETVPIIVPNTWIPIDLSEQCPKNDLIKSTIFRQQVLRGTIILMDSESAEKVMSTDEAKEEYARVSDELSSVAPTMEESNEESGIALRVDESSKNSNSDQKEINPIVYEALARDDISDAEIRNIIERNKVNFKKEDWMHIIQNTRSDSIKKTSMDYLSKTK